jgi:hypothetical protein
MEAPRRRVGRHNDPTAFSRNWGGWLADEAFEYLLGCKEIAQSAYLKSLLWKHLAGASVVIMTPRRRSRPETPQRPSAPDRRGASARHHGWPESGRPPQPAARPGAYGRRKCFDRPAPCRSRDQWQRHGQGSLAAQFQKDRCSGFEGEFVRGYFFLAFSCLIRIGFFPVPSNSEHPLSSVVLSLIRSVVFTVNVFFYGTICYFCRCSGVSTLNWAFNAADKARIDRANPGACGIGRHNKRAGVRYEAIWDIS